MKLITKEQIEALPKYYQHNDGYMALGEFGAGQYIKVSDLRALYDTLPSVGGDAVGFVLKPSHNLGFASQGTVKWTGNPVNEGTKLYTAPQPDLQAKVAELESKLAECEKDAERYKWIMNNLNWLNERYTLLDFLENKNEIQEAIDQAMKG